MTGDAITEQTQNLVQELRRGVIVLAVLSQLHTEQYGYSLMKCLEDQGMLVDQGTLYPLLRRMEEQGTAGKHLAHRHFPPPALLCPEQLRKPGAE